MTLSPWLILEQHRHLLTEKEVQVMELSVRGLSQRQMALALGLPRSTVQSRLETATARIRNAMKEDQRGRSPAADKA